MVLEPSSLLRVRGSLELLDRALVPAIPNRVEREHAGLSLASIFHPDGKTVAVRRPSDGCEVAAERVVEVIDLHHLELILWVILAGQLPYAHHPVAAGPGQ